MDANIRKAIEGNAYYWERRALYNRASIIEDEEQYLNRLQIMYDRAQQSMQKELSTVYHKYAKENTMTLEQAMKALPKEAETSYKNDVMNYIRVGRTQNPMFTHYLKNQSIMHEHNVINKLSTEFRMHIADIDLQATGGKFLSKIYTDTYYKAQYQNRSDDITGVSKNKIEQLLKQNWSGTGSFSEKIWGSQEKLAKALEEILLKGFASRDGWEQMSKALADKMSVSYNAAKRLILTESARMSNQALLDHYKETGVEQIKYIATLDMRTSEICRAMDGQVFNIEDAVIGENVPPLHPYCRSVISPYYEDLDIPKRVERDDDNHSNLTDYKDYEQWLKEKLERAEQKTAEGSNQSVNNYIPRQREHNIQYRNPNYKATLPKETVDTLSNMKEKQLDDINKKLEDSVNITGQLEKEITRIDNAISKLPYYTGTTTLDILPDGYNALETVQIGEVYQPTKYLLTTKKPFSYKDTKWRYVIESKTGYDIGKKVSSYKNKEVIFPRDTPFRLIDITADGDITVYHLVQIIE
jgi:putative phage head morphogenesis protein, SPP1 gp7 family